MYTFTMCYSHVIRLVLDIAYQVEFPDIELSNFLYIVPIFSYTQVPNFRTFHRSCETRVALHPLVSPFLFLLIQCLKMSRLAEHGNYIDLIFRLSISYHTRFLFDIRYPWLVLETLLYIRYTSLVSVILVRHPISTSTKWYQCGFPFIDIVSNSTLFICPISFTAFGGYTYRIHSYEILSIQFFIFRYRCRMKWIIVRYPIPITTKSYRFDFRFRYRIELCSRTRFGFLFIIIVSNSILVRYPISATTKSYRFDFSFLDIVSNSILVRYPISHHY